MYLGTIGRYLCKDPYRYLRYGYLPMYFRLHRYRTLRTIIKTYISITFKHENKRTFKTSALDWLYIFSLNDIYNKNYHCVLSSSIHKFSYSSDKKSLIISSDLHQSSQEYKCMHACHARTLTSQKGPQREVKSATRNGPLPITITVKFLYTK